MSSSSKEIITLQIGHYSNFVGTHLWNIQESTFSYKPKVAGRIPREINNDVLYREGETLLGQVTYTPRLISFDLKGSLNTLKPDGILYDIEGEGSNVPWSGDVTLHQSTPPHKNSFLSDLDSAEAMQTSESNGSDLQSPDKDEEDPPSAPSTTEPTEVKEKVYYLDDSINVWSDYLYGHLHPRTQVVVQEYLHNSDTETFDMFPQGKSLMNKRQVMEDLEDRLHFFVEECDHLQGFQVIADFCDGFSGLSSSIVETMQDDYKGKGILTWGVTPSTFSRQSPSLDSFRVINSVLSFDHLSQHSSLFTPLSLTSELWRKAANPFSFQNLVYNPDLLYHTSAILASAIDTALLPCRIIDEPLQLGQFCDLLNQSGRKLATLCSSFPFPLNLDSTLLALLHQHQDAAPWRPFLPHQSKFDKAVPFAQSVVLRGIPQNKLKSDPQPELQGLLKSARTVDEMMKLYLATLFPQTLSSCLTLKQACPTATPFPHIFSPNVSHEGFIGQRSRPYDQAVTSVPSLTSLQSSPCSRVLLKTLIKEAKKLDIRKFHGFMEGSIEQDEFSASVNNLEELAHAYEREFDVSEAMSDDDDD